MGPFSISLSFFLAFLLSLGVQAQDDNFFAMTQWTVSNWSDADAAQWTQSPTWAAVIALEDLKQQPGFTDLPEGQDIHQSVLEKVAEQHHTWLTSQDSSPYTPLGYCLVAVLYDLEKGLFWASTIPQGPQKVLMISAASFKQGFFWRLVSPNWWKYEDGMVVTEGKVVDADFHAEDGAYYNWESDPTNENRIANSTKYPDGMSVVVYGNYKGTGSSPSEPAQPWDLCAAGDDGTNGRVPSCVAVAEDLGINYYREASNTRRLRRRVRRDEPHQPLGHTNQTGLTANAARPAAPGTRPAAAGAQATGTRTSPNNSPHMVALANAANDVGAPPSAYDFEAAQQKLSPCHVGGSAVLTGIGECRQVLHESYAPDGSTVSIPTITTAVYTTKTAACSVCTSSINSASTTCNSMTSCLIQTPVVSLTMASEGLTVGTLSGSALYTSVSNALETICPSVTDTAASATCTGHASFPIKFAEEETLKSAEIIVTVDGGLYDNNAFRTWMINSVANGAMKSANGSNCRSETVDANSLSKRDQSSIFKRELIPEIPPTVTTEINTCSMSQGCIFNFWPSMWRDDPNPGSTNRLWVSYTFHESETALIAQQIACDVLEGLDALLMLLAPEEIVIEGETEGIIVETCSDLNIAAAEQEISQNPTGTT